MRIIGITGGIACGKSTVSSCLTEYGVYVIDGDKLSRELTSPNGSALPLIREKFGDAVFSGDQLDRKSLGRIVFSEPAELNKLNAIMQPLLYELIKRRISEAQANHYSLCGLDMPLLFESHLDSLCDSIWCVFVEPHLQIKRLIERDGLSYNEAILRINSQWPLSKKCELSDIVIDNSRTKEETKRLVLLQLKKELLLS